MFRHLSFLDHFSFEVEIDSYYKTPNNCDQNKVYL
jgi:hypothetical protein